MIASSSELPRGEQAASANKWMNTSFDFQGSAMRMARKVAVFGDDGIKAAQIDSKAVAVCPPAMNAQRTGRLPAGTLLR
jgi:hypothetical protein